MCLICQEYQKGKLKIHEALRNLEEMKETIDSDHYSEVYSKIYSDQIEKELEEYWKSVGFGD